MVGLTPLGPLTRAPLLALLMLRPGWSHGLCRASFSCLSTHRRRASRQTLARFPNVLLLPGVLDRTRLRVANDPDGVLRLMSERGQDDRGDRPRPPLATSAMHNDAFTRAQGSAYGAQALVHLGRLLGCRNGRVDDREVVDADAALPGFGEQRGDPQHVVLELLHQRHEEVGAVVVLQSVEVGVEAALPPGAGNEPVPTLTGREGQAQLALVRVGRRFDPEHL